MNKVLNNNKGIALVGVIMVIVVLAILGTAILQVSLAETKFVVKNHENTQAYYAARAGADAMASYIISNPDEVQNLISKTALNPGTGTISGNPFQVRVLNVASNKVQINSTGSVVNGTSSVNVSLTLQKVVNPVFNNAFFSNAAPAIGNNCTVIGDMGTNGSSISYGKKQVDGNITLGPDATAADIAAAEANSTSTDPVQKLTSLIAFPPINESNFTITLSDPSPTITLSNGDKIYAKAANVTDLSNVHITWPTGGNAELHLLVTQDNFVIGTNIDVPDGSTLYLYYNGTNNITGNGIFGMQHLVIYAPKATFHIQGGGNGTFRGKIIVKAATFPNSNAYFYNDASVNTNDIVGAVTYIRETWSK